MATPLEAARDALDAGDYRRARHLAEQAVTAGAARAESRRVLALALLYDDRGEEAEKLAEEALRIAKAAKDPGQTGLCELAVAEVMRQRGDWISGLEHASRASRLATKAGDERMSTLVLSEYALLLSRHGDDDRARDVFARVMPNLTLLPKTKALRVLYNCAMAHRAAGRYAFALETIERANEFPRGGSTANWLITAARLLTLIDMGAFAEAAEVLDAVDEAPLTSGWIRAQLFAFRAGIGLSSGQNVDRLIEQGLAIRGLEPPLRFALERIHALSLVARGNFVEAERIAIALTATAAKGGTRSNAAQGLAIAARAGAPDAWLLRWLGALACATGGSNARIEHEAYAALVTEPEPIGQLAKNALATSRARLVENAPPAYRKGFLKTLRQVEQRMASLRQTKMSEASLAVSDDAMRIKDEVGLAGQSPRLMKVVATVARAARSTASLVFTGETGSGKELFAKLAHLLSPRAKARFVAVNVAAIPEPLLEAELFGHERGAFTGADRARSGLFVEAEGGTLFLDEVGEMSPAMQAKLLRVLEDGEVRAIGGSRTRKVDVRVVAATHRDLSLLVAQGTFREDLYYRLAAITVRVPSLRERPEDLPVVVRALLARDPATREHRLDVPALAILSEHTWPGNVRELANVLQVAATMVEGRVIGRPELASAIGSASRVTRDDVEKSALKETTLAALRARHRAELQQLVGRALASSDGNKREAAKSLGVSRQGLYRVLEG